MARAALQIGVRDLAEASGISAITITRFETGKSGAYESRRPVISRNVSTILRQALV
jgi:transcriptional regulator with XRE-family HTH domain